MSGESVELVVVASQEPSAEQVAEMYEREKIYFLNGVTLLSGGTHCETSDLFR